MDAVAVVPVLCCLYINYCLVAHCIAPPPLITLLGFSTGIRFCVCDSVRDK
jgi:hypothetical protein